MRCLQCVQMLQSTRDLVLPALQRRLVLLANHVLSRESAATERLRAHAGRVLRVEPQGLPPWLPALPALMLVVTPAGLFDQVETADESGPVDLRLLLAADQPVQWLAAAAGGARPAVTIEGDAAFAADIHWLADNLRWDIEADLATLLGPVVAHQLGRWGRALAAALRERFAPAGAAGAAGQ